MTPVRVGNTWIRTYTGRTFWPLAPAPEDVHELDIAHALSNVCRFTGHCRDFYSVAQHSVHVSELLQLWHPKNRLLWMAGLLHDASEAYIADLAAPIKQSGEFGKYKMVEKVLEDCICLAFGLYVSEAEHAHIKHADLVMLATEGRDLMTDWKPSTPSHLPPAREAPIVPWIPAHAKDQFLKRLAWCRAQL